MALNKAYNQYKKDSIYTSTPEELTLMLYNGLVKFIMQSRMAIGENNIEKANNSIVRAQDILLYLQSALDEKYEVSKGLMLLYDYMNRRLVEANVAKDDEILEEILGYAKELRDTWTQAMKIAKIQQKKLQTV